MNTGWPLARERVVVSCALSVGGQGQQRQVNAHAHFLPESEEEAMCSDVGRGHREAMTSFKFLTIRAPPACPQTWNVCSAPAHSAAGTTSKNTACVVGTMGTLHVTEPH